MVDSANQTLEEIYHTLNEMVSVIGSAGVPTIKQQEQRIREIALLSAATSCGEDSAITKIAKRVDTFEKYIRTGKFD